MPASSPNIDKMAQAIRVLRTLDDDMALGAVVVLFHVASEVPDGSWMKMEDLMSQVDMSSSRAHRAVSLLADFATSLKPALGLLDIKVSPEDRRRRLVSLTPRGRMVMRQIEDALT